MSQNSASRSSDPSGLGETQNSVPAPVQSSHTHNLTANETASADSAAGRGGGYNIHQSSSPSSQTPTFAVRDVSSPDPTGRGGGYNAQQPSSASTQTPSFAIRDTSSTDPTAGRGGGYNPTSTASQLPSSAIQVPTEPVNRVTPASSHPATAVAIANPSVDSSDGAHDKKTSPSQTITPTIDHQTSPSSANHGSSQAAPASSGPSHARSFAIRNTSSPDPSGRGGGYNATPSTSTLPTFARPENNQRQTRDLSLGSSLATPEFGGRGAEFQLRHQSPDFGGRGGGYNAVAEEVTPRTETPQYGTNAPATNGHQQSQGYPRVHSEGAENGGFGGRGGGYNATPRAESPGFGGRGGGYNDTVGRESPQPERPVPDIHHQETMHDYPRAHPEHAENGGFGGRGGGYNAQPRAESPSFGGRGGGYNDEIKRPEIPLSSRSHEHEQDRHHHESLHNYPRAHAEHGENGGFGGRGGGYNASPRDQSPSFGGRGGGYNDDIRKLSPRPSPAVEKPEHEYHHQTENFHDYPHAHVEHSENGGFGGRGGGYNATPRDQSPGFGGRGGGYNDDIGRLLPKASPKIEQHEHEHRPESHDYPQAHPEHGENGGFGGRGGGYNASPRDQSPGFGGRGGGYNDDIRRLSPRPSPAIEKPAPEYHHHQVSHDYPRAHPEHGENGGFGGRGGGYNASPHGSRTPSPSGSTSRDFHRSDSPYKHGSRDVSPSGRSEHEHLHHHEEHNDGYPRMHADHEGFGGRGGGYNATLGAN